MSGRGFVESLLHDQSPAGFSPDGDDVAVIRTAIELRAARPGSGELTDDALSALRDRVADRVATAAATASDQA